jgi:hypothetical protein
MIAGMTPATGTKMGRPSKGPRVRLSAMVARPVHATAEYKAKELGMTITDYLQYLVVRDNPDSALLGSASQRQEGSPFADVA